LFTSLKNEMNNSHHFFLVVGVHTFSLPNASRHKVQIRRKIKCFIPISIPKIRKLNFMITSGSISTQYYESILMHHVCYAS